MSAEFRTRPQVWQRLELSSSFAFKTPQVSGEIVGQKQVAGDDGSRLDGNLIEHRHKVLFFGHQFFISAPEERRWLYVSTLTPGGNV